MAQGRRRPRLLPLHAVMAGQSRQRQIEHNARRAARPLPLALDGLEPFQKSADIQQQAGKLRPDRLHGFFDALTRSQSHIGQRQARRLPAPALARHTIPARGDARLCLGALEIAAQALARFKMLS